MPFLVLNKDRDITVIQTHKKYDTEMGPDEEEVDSFQLHIARVNYQTTSILGLTSQMLPHRQLAMVIGRSTAIWKKIKVCLDSLHKPNFVPVDIWSDHAKHWTIGSRFRGCYDSSIFVI